MMQVLSEDEDAFDVSGLLSINREFAKNYEDRKRREELQALSEKYAEYTSEEDSESGSEEDEAAELDPQVDAQLLKTIYLIRSRDSSIYDGEKTFFEEKVVGQAAEPKEAALSLKQYHNRLLGEEIESSDEENRPPTYNQEQEQVRSELLRAASGPTEEVEDVLVRKPGGEDRVDDSSGKYKSYIIEVLEKEKAASKTMQVWLSALSGKKESDSGRPKDASDAQNDERFLADYILGRGWLPKKGREFYKLENDSEDEEHVEAAEEFETAFNMRHEDGGIIGYARENAGFRRVDGSRIQKRKAKTEKQAQAKLREDEDLKRLKNLKKLEIRKKIEKVGKVGGTNAAKLEKILDAEFDPESFDRDMSLVYNESYYAQDDSEGDAAKDVKELDDLEDEYFGLHYEDKVADVHTRFRYRSVVPSAYGLDLEEILTADDKKLNRHVSLKRMRPYRSHEEEQKDLERYSRKKTVNRFRYAN